MKKRGRVWSLLLIVPFFIIVACSGGEMESQKETYKNLNDIPDSAWEELSKKKIYFGHQSVGFNIIDGIQDLMKEYPKIKLNIVETSDIKKLSGGVFAHSTIGENKKPKTKVDDFERIVSGNAISNLDVAFLKFCYVDGIEATENPYAIFNYYKSAIDKLTQNNKKIKFIHFAMPLRIIQTGPKAWINKVINRKIGGYEENLKINQFNNLLVNEYQGNAPIFNIAKIESTNPDGTRSTFNVNGKTYYALVPDYTNDGGHLNEIGRKRVASELLVTLVNEI